MSPGGLKPEVTVWNGAAIHPPGLHLGSPSLDGLLDTGPCFQHLFPERGVLRCDAPLRAQAGMDLDAIGIQGHGRASAPYRALQSIEDGFQVDGLSKDKLPIAQRLGSLGRAVVGAAVRFQPFPLLPGIR